MKKVFGFGLLFLLIAHLFGAMVFMGSSHRGSASVAQEAWARGYIAGQQAATGEDGATESAVPPSHMDGMESYGHHGYSGYESYGHGYDGQYDRHQMGAFSIFGMMFRCLIPLFLIGGLFMFIGKRGCRHHGRGEGRSHRGCRPPWAGHRPPWADRGEGQEPRWVADDPSDDEPSSDNDDDLPTADEIHEKSPEDLE